MERTIGRGLDGELTAAASEQCAGSEGARGTRLIVGGQLPSGSRPADEYAAVDCGDCYWAVATRTTHDRIHQAIPREMNWTRPRLLIAA